MSTPIPWQMPAVMMPPAAAYLPTGGDRPMPPGTTRLNAMAGNAGLFDAFEVSRVQPRLQTSHAPGWRQRVLHPFQTAAQGRALSVNLAASGETLAQRRSMMATLHAALDGDGRRHLKTLMTSGRLMDISAENGHSTLYQLYAIFTTPRQQGLQARQTLRETLAILARPEAITQKITPLESTSAQAILTVRNTAPLLNRERVRPPERPLTRQDIEIPFSNACVPSSVMFSMADKRPSEFARQVNELTSPMSAFLRTVPLSAISPQNPAGAYAILDQNDVTYYRAGPDRVTVRFSLPPAGVLRAINDGLRDRHFKTRSAVETAYQSALAFTVTQRTYDPAIDQSADYAGGPMLQGLNAMQKDLMETLIKGGAGIKSVNFMITGATPTPRSPEEADQPFLFGYTRDFEQTQRDLMAALDTGSSVIIGFVPVNARGMVLPGHEITLAGYEQDAKTGEVRFITFDSDDNNPDKVMRSARDLIPRIHHAGLPQPIAQRIEADMKQSPGYFRPNAQDRAHFKPVPVAADPMPAEALAQALPTIPGAPATNTPFPGTGSPMPWIPRP